MCNFCEKCQAPCIHHQNTFTFFQQLNWYKLVNSFQTFPFTALLTSINVLIDGNKTIFFECSQPCF